MDVTRPDCRTPGEGQSSRAKAWKEFRSSPARRCMAPLERERKAAPLSPYGTLVLSNGLIRRVPKSGLARAMAALAFDLVYFSGLTADDILGCVVSLLACLLLFKAMATDPP